MEKRKEGLVGESGPGGRRLEQSDNIRANRSFENSNENEDHDEVTPPERPLARERGEKGQVELHDPAGPKEGYLRDLTREAYSRSSLHTYKSDPLHRGRGGGYQRAHGVATVNPPIREVGRGRGQPNMKLRMGAMLEKIKREYS